MEEYFYECKYHIFETTSLLVKGIGHLISIQDNKEDKENKYDDNENNKDNQNIS